MREILTSPFYGWGLWSFKILSSVLRLTHLWWQIHSRASKGFRRGLPNFGVYALTTVTHFYEKVKETDQLYGQLCLILSSSGSNRRALLDEGSQTHFSEEKSRDAKLKLEVAGKRRGGGPLSRTFPRRGANCSPQSRLALVFGQHGWCPLSLPSAAGFLVWLQRLLFQLTERWWLIFSYGDNPWKRPIPYQPGGGLTLLLIYIRHKWH